MSAFSIEETGRLQDVFTIGPLTIQFPPGTDVPAVPEPGSLAFLGLGLAPLGWSLRRRRKRAP